MKRIVILGGGESGCGAAILAKKKGMDVFLSDRGKIADRYKNLLDENGIEWEEGEHTEAKILNADEVIKSPGIPPTAPLICKIVEKGIPVISEIEFAGRYTNARMACITGSNGKTTTTLMLHHILLKAGIDAGLGGNVGQSLALQVAEGEHDVYVIELSSFQLENMYDFRANVAVITNITPDHMDRYDHKMANYVSAKFRILQNQTADDAVIYWAEDSVVTDKMTDCDTPALHLPFSTGKKIFPGAWADKETIELSTPRGSWSMNRGELSLKGLHNLYNSMAAALAAYSLGVKPEIIREALQDFSAVEHRLEFVAEVDGVRYINDSKATNVNSTWYALESMTTPVVLILGGTDKGNDYTEIESLVKEKVRAVVCMGKDNRKLMDFFESRGVEIYDTGSLKDAISACRRVAHKGDTVLLSPCCASFDLFKNYENRGELFKEAVREML